MIKKLQAFAGYLLKKIEDFATKKQAPVAHDQNPGTDVSVQHDKSSSSGLVREEADGEEKNEDQKKKPENLNKAVEEQVKELQELNQQQAKTIKDQAQTIDEMTEAEDNLQVELHDKKVELAHSEATRDEIRVAAVEIAMRNITFGDRVGIVKPNSTARVAHHEIEKELQRQGRVLGGMKRDLHSFQNVTGTTGPDIAIYGIAAIKNRDLDAIMNENQNKGFTKGTMKGRTKVFKKANNLFEVTRSDNSDENNCLSDIEEVDENTEEEVEADVKKDAEEEIQQDPIVIHDGTAEAKNENEEEDAATQPTGSPHSMDDQDQSYYDQYGNELDKTRVEANRDKIKFADENDWNDWNEHGGDWNENGRDWTYGETPKEKIERRLKERGPIFQDVGADKGGKF